MRLTLPDSGGRFRDVLLGYASETAYATNPAYMGCVVGRTAGRIWPSEVRIGGRSVGLPVNEGRECHLHGGPQGWHRANWAVLERAGGSSNTITFRHHSESGESGYPGSVIADVRYELTDDNRWLIQYAITTDQDTIVSPTQHAYFNLAGHQAGRIDDHVVTLRCKQQIRLGDHKAADGNLDPVAGSTVDFRAATALGLKLGEQGGNPGGIDHCFVVSPDGANALRRAAKVYSPSSGISLEVLTDQPALHFYTGNYLDGNFQGKAGIRYPRQSGFCLEAQEFPNAVNHPSFPQGVLSAGQTYLRRTEYRFGIENFS